VALYQFESAEERLDDDQQVFPNYYVDQNGQQARSQPDQTADDGHPKSINEQKRCRNHDQGDERRPRSRLSPEHPLWEDTHQQKIVTLSFFV
jgi:hypothetical protein